MATREPRPFDVEYIENPSQSELRELALAHTPCVQQTAVGSINKVSRNKARMAKYTYIIDTEDRWSHQIMDPDKARGLIERQAKYIADKGKLIAIDGYVGLGEGAFGATWLYTPEGANIAGMQQILAFPRSDVETEEQLAAPFEPIFRLYYTPDLQLDDMPGGQAIIVDMENWTTHVIGADYFGESKKGILRMLNHYVYQKGGLVLHAGAKAVTDANGNKLTMTIMGLSGTGKTTTTFSKQGDITEPIQDDMVALWPHGALSITENGCFAKTDGLSLETEPVLFTATTGSEAWLENVFLEADGSFHFTKGVLSAEDVARLRDILIATGANVENVDKYMAGGVNLDDVVDSHGIPADGWDFVVWTQNGRSIVPMSSIPDAADLRNIPQVKSMGILNRDEGYDAAMPGIVRFTSPEQAAGYFMLGETSKTSAAGKDRGKTRSPFTQPFFPAKHGLQAKRFAELAATMSGVTMWLMNTGYIGGEANDAKENKALNIKIRHSSAMLEALLSETIKWKKDPDFGYEIVDVDAPENADLVGKVPAEILDPRRFYDGRGRHSDYEQWVSHMKEARTDFLKKFDVADAIVAAIAG
ncbi:MAG: phosphoenolpyruvate carboxykinase (ATP) [Deltaproteobacteria bacterium]|nr:phosphoenolpyruvate carboxykinase (ATP) [Deltaproteobacteria bacterium]MBW2549192.1 phosphoenolpyruvate carboxykinase (ATP) [Deltaproteobacteria bacterium]MBW2625986.1 phosphoenolpyruvate carboxykinase (ATP) [Deltaproteobacteria bacterium]